MKKNVLVFGVSGQIGREVADFFIKKNYHVFGVVRNDVKSYQIKDLDLIQWNVFDEIPESIKKIGNFHSICWAQGQNYNDSIYDFNEEDHLNLYRSNCLYITSSLNKILKNNLLPQGAKLCIISSIWQNIARQNKMSYCITKSALQGLVNSLAIDLAKDNHLINAILPGAIDTKMTINNLSETQLQSLLSSTYFNRLSNIKDIAALAYFLCSEENTSISGQFINIDLAFSNARIV